MKIRCGLIGLGRIGCGFDDDPNKKTISTHAGGTLWCRPREKHADEQRRVHPHA